MSNDLKNVLRVIAFVGIVALWFAIIATTSGCAGGRNYVYGEIGHKVQGRWQTGASPTTGFGLMRRNDEGRYCAWRHTSNVLTGEPFNGRTENWLDQIVCGMEFEL